MNDWLTFLKLQKEILTRKLKIYGITKKVEDNYRMVGEEVYLFSKKPKTHKSVFSDGRVKFLLDEINKDHDIIAETEKEIFEIKETIMGDSSGERKPEPSEEEKDA